MSRAIAITIIITIALLFYMFSAGTRDAAWKDVKDSLSKFYDYLKSKVTDKPIPLPPSNNINTTQSLNTSLP